MLGKLKVNKVIPSSLFRHQNIITDWFFGIKTKSEKQLLRNILKDTNPKFLSWAIDKIINWKNIQNPENTIHIHGTSDRIIPIRNVQIDYKIENGGHFMTVNKYLEIENILKNACT